MSLHYVLDGYNIIIKNPLKQKGLKDRRERLIRLVEKICLRGKKGVAATVVFDGDREIFSPIFQSEVRVVFTKGESADEWIKRFIEKNRGPRQCVVVSDDREILFYVRASGAKTMTVDGFLSLENKKPAKTRDEKKSISSGLARKITEELKDVWLKGGQ